MARDSALPIFHLIDRNTFNLTQQMIARAEPQCLGRKTDWKLSSSNSAPARMKHQRSMLLRSTKQCSARLRSG